MDPNLAATIQGASNIQAPATPYPELQKYYGINFQAPLSSAGVKALTGQAGAVVDQQQFDTKKKISDLQNGKGYQRVARSDGGYGFYDPNGQEVSAYDYARATGKNAAEVLADSQNPVDIGFTQDYQNLQDFMTAATSGDSEKLQAYYDQNPALKNMSPQEVLQKFREAYPTVYGGKKAGVPVGQTAIPSLYDFQRGAGDIGTVGA